MVDMCLRMREHRSVLNEEEKQLADLYMIYSAMVEWSSIFFTLV